MTSKRRTSLQEFLFQMETRTFVISSLIGFSINRFINDLQEVAINRVVFRSIKAIYNEEQIEHIIENTHLTRPVKELRITAAILVAFLQLACNFLLIYIVYLVFENCASRG